MSKCTDYSITFTNNDPQVLASMKQKLADFFAYDKKLYVYTIDKGKPVINYYSEHCKELVNILMCGATPFDRECKDINTDLQYFELVRGIDFGIEDDGYNSPNTVSYGDTGGGADWLFVNFAHLNGAEFHSRWYPCEEEWEAEESEYKNGIYTYRDAELSEDDKQRLVNEYEIDVDDLVDIAGEIRDELETMIEKCEPQIIDIISERRDVIIDDVFSVSIDCETNYLDNLKSFINNNITIPNLDEHLVKSGLFKTTIGTEKRKRIEVEVNGVKLFADSKPGIKQRKRNVKKLEELLTK